MTKRVLTGQIQHETNTSSVLSATLDSYGSRLLLEGSPVTERLAGTNNEIAGVIEVAATQSWDLVAAVTTDRHPARYRAGGKNRSLRSSLRTIFVLLMNPCRARYYWSMRVQLPRRI